MSLLNSRVNITLDYYFNETEDILENLKFRFHRTDYGESEWRYC